MSDRREKEFLRLDFERYVRKLNHKANVERADDGGYKHYGTELSWSIYLHAFYLGQKRALTQTNIKLKEAIASLESDKA